MLPIRTINEIFCTIPLAFRRGGACPSSCTECCHPHNHCKRTIIPRPASHLPPLPKVRCCRPIKFGRRPEELPHHYPSPRTISLPPLSKGGGLTASHKLSLCCVLLAIRPPFLFTKLFAVKTEGLLYHPSLSTTFLPPLPKGAGLRQGYFLL